MYGNQIETNNNNTNNNLVIFFFLFKNRSSLANDDILWKSLCQSTWGYASCYNNNKNKQKSYRTIFMHLDEATLTFNANGWRKVSLLLYNVIYK